MRASKKSLLASGVSLLASAALLAGATFAWFTDSVTNTGNKIQSGKLAVTLEKFDPAAEEGNGGYVDAGSAPLFDYDKWEPGYTAVASVKIGNNGTLALKYEVDLVVNGEASALADVIDVYYRKDAGAVSSLPDSLDGLTKVGTLSELLAETRGAATGHLSAGGADFATIALHMQESAGNAYQELSIGAAFDIVVKATQYTEEEDGFGSDQYDKDAPLDFVPVATAEQLLAASTAGGTVSMTGDIAPSKALSITNAVLNGNGNRLIGGQLGDNARIINLTNLSGPASLTVNGVNMVGETAQFNSKGISAYDADSITLDVKDSRIEARAYALRIGTGVTNGAELNMENTTLVGWAGLDTHAKTNAVFRNVTFNGTNYDLSGDSNGYDAIEFQEGSEGSTVLLENCTFNLIKSGEAAYGFIGANFDPDEGNITVICRGCTFIYNGETIAYADVPAYTYNMTGTNSLVIE